jgi:hypothetical protein
MVKIVLMKALDLKVGLSWITFGILVIGGFAYKIYV